MSMAWNGSTSPRRESETTIFQSTTLSAHVGPAGRAAQMPD
jgi:hypothetical protein